MGNNKSRKTAPERAKAVVKEWIGTTNGRGLLSVLGLGRLTKLIQIAIAHADKATLARDDIRDGKPQHRAFHGGKSPRA